MLIQYYVVPKGLQPKCRSTLSNSFPPFFFSPFLLLSLSSPIYLPPILLPLLFPSPSLSFPFLPPFPLIPPSPLPFFLPQNTRLDMTLLPHSGCMQPHQTICMHNRFTIVNCQNYSFTQCLNVLMNSVRVNVVMNGFCCCLIEGYAPARNYTTRKHRNQLPGSFCSSEVCLQLNYDFT